MNNRNCCFWDYKILFFLLWFTLLFEGIYCEKDIVSANSNINEYENNSDDNNANNNNKLTTVCKIKPLSQPELDQQPRRQLLSNEKTGRLDLSELRQVKHLYDIDELHVQLEEDGDVYKFNNKSPMKTAAGKSDDETIRRMEFSGTNLTYSNMIHKQNFFYGEGENATIDIIFQKGSEYTFGSLIDLKKKVIAHLIPDNTNNESDNETTTTTRYVIKPASQYPEEADTPPPRRRLGHDQVSSRNKKQSSFLRSKEYDESPTTYGINTNSAMNSIAQSRNKNNGNNRNLQKEKKVDNDDVDTSIIDILVLWTKNTECSLSNLPVNCTLTDKTEAIAHGIINLAVEETNVAYQLSGIKALLRLVHARREESYQEPTKDETSDIRYEEALYYIGESEDVLKTREEYGADLVHMIVDDSRFCGMGHSALTKDLGYSISWWQCSTGYFSFGHEIGHNLNCRHNRLMKNNCTEMGYNFGYRDPMSRFRTIMSLGCVNGGCDVIFNEDCMRIQYFSNVQDNVLYEGSAIGTKVSNNAQQINKRVQIVKNWYPTTIHDPVCNVDSDCNDYNTTTMDVCVSASQCHYISKPIKKEYDGSACLRPEYIYNKDWCKGNGVGQGRANGCRWDRENKMCTVRTSKKDIPSESPSVAPTSMPVTETKNVIDTSDLEIISVCARQGEECVYHTDCCNRKCSRKPYEYPHYCKY